MDMVHKKIENEIRRLNEKIDALHASLSGRISKQDERLGEKIAATRDRVSRIEGHLNIPYNHTV